MLKAISDVHRAMISSNFPRKWTDRGRFESSRAFESPASAYVIKMDNSRGAQPACHIPKSDRMGVS
jgi:hypothetical protein